MTAYLLRQLAQKYPLSGNHWRLEELWVYNGADWIGLWLQPGVTEDDSKIGPLLASGISPINHPTTGPGTLYA